MKIRTSGLNNQLDGLHHSLQATEQERPKRIMEFVKRLAQYFLLQPNSSADAKVRCIGNLLVEKLTRADGDGIVLMQGKLGFEGSLQTHGHLLRVKKDEFRNLAREYNLSLDTIEAIELSKFGGYEMYSLRYTDQEVEAVLLDEKKDTFDYEVWNAAY